MSLEVCLEDKASASLPESDSMSQALQNYDPESSELLDPPLTRPRHGSEGSSPAFSRTVSRIRMEVNSDNSFEGDPELAFLREGVPVPFNHIKLDDYTVAFNGPDDLTNPQNWPFKRKVFNSFLVLGSMACVVFSSSSYTPAVPYIAEEFKVAEIVALLGLSLFVLGFAVGPVIGGPLSELYGRRVVIVISIIGFTLFQFAVATAKDLQTVLLCRFFGSAVGSSAMVVGPGAFADMYSSRMRGTSLNVFAATVLILPTIGPVVGGFVAKSYLGWRWVNYLTGIMGGFFMTLTILFYEESHAGVILSRKAERIRRSTKVWAVHAAHEEKSLDFKEIVNNNILRPIKMLLTEPILLLVSIYVAFVYGLLYLLLPAYPVVFAEGYHMAGGVCEIPYLSIAIGVFAGGAFCIYCDQHSLREIEENNGVLVPESRLVAMKFGCFAFPAGILWFFWTGNYPEKVHWMAPSAAGVLVGFGLLTIFTCSLNYILDVYLVVAASAMAANTFLRSAWAAAFPLFATPMLHGMGINWAGLMLGIFGIILCPVPFLFSKYGERIRRKSKYNLN